MADPTAFTPGFDYSDFQTTNPTTPLPGDEVDSDFHNLETSITSLRSAVMDVRRSDGRLKNQIVRPESLHSSVVLGIGEPETWLTATAYAPPDAVWVANKLYRCILAHTSGVFATDLAASKWALVLDLDTPLGEAEASATAAAASAAAAQTAETNAETAETNAETAETNAETAATTATAQAVIATAQAVIAAAAAAAAVAAQRYVPVRVVDAAAGSPTTDYQNGDTVDGVVLVTGDIVLRATPGGNAADGPYVVVATGAASRATNFAAYNAFPGAMFAASEGTLYAQTIWRVSSVAGGTIGVTAITIAIARFLPTITASDLGKEVAVNTGLTGYILRRRRYLDAVADLGCDNGGTNVTTTAVNAAMTAAVAAGVDLYFPRGTYNVDDDEIRLTAAHNNLRIIGEGEDRTLFKRTSDVNNAILSIYEASGIRLEGLGWNYTPTTYTTGYGQHGIAIRNGASNIRVIGCGGNGKINHGLFIFNSRDVLVEGWRSYGTGNSAIRIVNDHDAAADYPSVVGDEDQPIPIRGIHIRNAIMSGAATMYGTTQVGTYGIVGAAYDHASDLLDGLFITDCEANYFTSQGFNVGGDIRHIVMVGNKAVGINDGAGSGVGFTVQTVASQLPFWNTLGNNVASACVIGFYDNAGAWNAYTGCIAESCTTHGFLINDTDYATFAACIANNNAGDGFSWTGNATRNSAVGCFAVGNGGTGFLTGASTDYIGLASCRAISNTTAQINTAGGTNHDVAGLST